MHSIRGNVCGMTRHFGGRRRSGAHKKVKVKVGKSAHGRQPLPGQVERPLLLPGGTKVINNGSEGSVGR